MHLGLADPRAGADAMQTQSDNAHSDRAQSAVNEALRGSPFPPPQPIFIRYLGSHLGCHRTSSFSPQMRAQILLEFNVAPRSRNRGAIENQHGALLQTDDPRRQLNVSWRALFVFARSCCSRARVSGARALSSSEQHHRARAGLRRVGKAWRRHGASPDAHQSPGQQLPARWHRVRRRRGLR